MKNELTDESLMRLSNHLAQNMGINFSSERFSDLKTKMTALADAFEFDDLEEFVGWLLSDRLDREQIELLADFLTVGETYFFRDPNSFLVLENEIFPQLLAARQQTKFMRIWSVACCTGEEPYSIAMLLNKMIPDINNWQISIFGTDINQTFLERAAEGIYSDWSFRATPDFFKNRYFRPFKNKYQIDPQIKKLVRFDWMNLADLECLTDPNYSSMDIVFCRNVLIYFGNELANRIISSLRECLVPDGYLFVGPNELPASNDKSLRSLHRNGTIVLQKMDRTSQGNPDRLGISASAASAAFASSDSASPACTASGSASPACTASDSAAQSSTSSGSASPACTASDSAAQSSTSSDSASAVSATSTAESATTTLADLSAVSATRELDLHNYLPTLEEAQALHDKGLYQEATELLLRRCKSGGDFPSMVLLAKSFANHSDLKSALRWCDLAIKANRLNAAAHYLRATILQEQGANREAVHSLKQTLLMDPSFVLAEFNLGILLRQTGNLLDAQRHLKAALKLLETHQDSDVLPESDGTTASAMRDIVSSLMAETKY